jgi:hypothetical protein
MARGRTKDGLCITGVYSPRTFLFLPRPVKSVEHGKEYGMKGLHKIRGTYENHTSLILWDVA